MTKFNSSASLIDYKIIIVALLFVVAFASTLLVLWPNFQDLQKTQRIIEEKRIELDTKEEYLFGLEQARNSLGDYQEEITKINSSLPDNPSIPSLFNYLQKIASEAGVILKETGSFRTASFNELPPLKQTSFSIELIGPYQFLKDFLSELEESARLISIEDISFSSPMEGDLFVFELKIKVYSY